MLTGQVRDRLAGVADRLLTYPFTCWNYGDSVGFEGLLAASNITGVSRWADWVHGYARAWSGMPPIPSDREHTAPGHALCLCFERTQDERLLAALEQLAGRILSRPRYQGVLVTFEATPYVWPPNQPIPPSDADTMARHNPGVFSDTMHFDGPFLAHLGRILDRPDLADEAARQALLTSEMLRDETTGLYHHFVLDGVEGQFINGWGRGQGWALLGLLDVAEQLGPDHPAREDLADRARQLARATLSYQRSDGGWSAMLLHPDSGLEASTGSFLATGFLRGIRLGFFDPQEFSEPAERAWSATWRTVDDDGWVRDVSFGVSPSLSLYHYCNTKTGSMVPWGQGPALLAAQEVLRASGEL